MVDSHINPDLISSSLIKSHFDHKIIVQMHCSLIKKIYFVFEIKIYTH